MMSGIEAIIAAAVAVAVLVPALAVLVAFVLARIYFGGYVRRNHPSVWRELLQRGSNLDATSLRLSFDATPEIAEFRVSSTDDLGDPEVATRRALANQAERLCMVAFIGGAAWIVISAAAIVWLRS